MKISDNTYRQLYIQEMNNTASSLNMINTTYTNAYGEDIGAHYSTAADALLVLAACYKSSRIMEAMAKETFTFHVDGPNARNITVTSTYKGSVASALGNYYTILGGKTGTTSVYNLTSIVKSKTDDAILIGAVYNAGTSPTRFAQMKQLFDWLEAYRKDPSATATIVGQGLAACVLKDNIIENTPQVYKNAGTLIRPASTTKLMTAYLIDKYLKDDNETIVINADDIIGGSGPLFKVGDIVKVGDFLAGMLLPSSNTLAEVAGRLIG